MISVLHFLSALDGGGVENSIVDYYSALEKYPIRFDFVVFGDKQGILEENLIKKGSKVFHVTPKKDNIVKHYLEIRKIIIKNEYDIIHSHQAEKGFITHFLCRTSSYQKSIMHSHGANQNSSFFQFILHFIGRYISLRYSDLVVACSRLSALTTYGAKVCSKHNVQIVPNVYKVNRFIFSQLNRNEMRKQLELNEEDFVLGMVGRLSTEKNHIFALEVLKTLLQKYNNIKLLIVGDGPNYNTIKNLAFEYRIESHVLFTGAQVNIEKYYNAMDLFLFPSLHEGFGMALVEAQMNGLNCIYSDFITKEAVVLNDRTSALELDIDKWSKAIVDKLKSQNLMSRYVDIDLFNMFDAEVQAVVLFNLYRGILG